MADFDRESMLEMFTFEMNQLLEQLEQNIIQGESGYSLDAINEIFRIMHTIKGSAAMMLFNSISTTAHAIEDVFYYLREEKPQGVDYSKLTDLVLEASDLIKEELLKIESGLEADGDGTHIIHKIKDFLSLIKGEAPGGQKLASNVTSQTKDTKNDASSNKLKNIGEVKHYSAKLMFEDGCEMENVRAYTIIYNLEDKAFNISYEPEDVIDETSIDYIRKNGFHIKFSSNSPYNELNDFLQNTIYLKSLEFTEIKDTSKNVINKFEVFIRFEDGCEMENVRAFTLIHNLEGKVNIISHIPEDVISESSINIIRKDGFIIEIETDKSYDEVQSMLSDTIYLKEVILKEKESKDENIQEEPKSDDYNILAEPLVIEEDYAAKINDQIEATQSTQAKKAPIQHVISVNVSKLDQLLNLMGELVISEAMVTQNPELESLELESFHKEARQLHKIINDVQDTVMSMRMVPLSTTFFKMHRIVRDMCKQLDKDVTLEVIGEETEVDKNIIEHISDPLMHIIRNSIDHGVERPDVRRKLGKPEKSTVLLQAKNTGGDVLIIVKDDGAGLNKNAIMEKAKNNGLLRKPESEYTDKEIHQFIFLPGFSTNDKVTNFSGRGVGMDVVSTNIEIVGGSVLVDSVPGEGSTFTLKIPLTLAIIEGMTIKMGNAKYTIPIISIKQQFKAKQEDLFIDPDNNEMITVRGEVYNVVRLYNFFNVESQVTNVEDGIMIMLENSDQTVCVFADELIGEQQVVVKTMPKYIKKIRGISGCTLLGNGDISLIIDVAGFFDK